MDSAEVAGVGGQCGRSKSLLGVGDANKAPDGVTAGNNSDFITQSAARVGLANYSMGAGDFPSVEPVIDQELGQLDGLGKGLAGTNTVEGQVFCQHSPGVNQAYYSFEFFHRDRKGQQVGGTGDIFTQCGDCVALPAPGEHECPRDAVSAKRQERGRGRRLAPPIDRRPSVLR